MAGLIDDLISILKDQAANLSDMLGLSKEKTSVIIENNLTELQKITELENILVSRYNKLDKNRVSIMKDIALVLNLDEKTASLESVALAISGQKEYTTLKELSEKLFDIVTALKESNDKNQLLINHSLDYVEFSMNVIRNVRSDGLSLTGEERLESGRQFFDAKQ